LKELRKQRHHDDSRRCVYRLTTAADTVCGERLCVCVIWSSMMRALREHTDVLQVSEQQHHHDDWNWRVHKLTSAADTVCGVRLCD